ncbi:MAG: hypothetical protein LE178_03435 [Endomicrobium sp.]|nr:hypothetical protein [Endomicrobium sp.]
MFFFDLPDNAKISIVNDSSNEYRALNLLRETRVCKTKTNYFSSHRKHSRCDVKTYIKPINLLNFATHLLPVSL